MKTVGATTGGRPIWGEPGDSSLDRMGQIKPGTLKSLGTFEGVAAGLLLPGPSPKLDGRPGSIARVWAEAVADACHQLDLAFPGIAPPPLDWLLDSRRLYCNGTIHVSIDVYEWEEIGLEDWLNEVTK